MGCEQISFEKLQHLLEQRQWDEFRLAVSRVDPADLADFIEELSSQDRDRVFHMLDLETASDVLVELQHNYVDEVVEDLPSAQIADLAGQMAPDEAADFLSDLDEEQSKLVLAAMKPTDRAEMRELLAYDEDSAGHLMTPEALSLPSSTTVEETRNVLATTDLSDPVFYVYVVAPIDNKLRGYVSLQDLVTARSDAKLGDIANPDYVYCTPEEDQEEVARKFRKYDLWVMPVVDQQQRLIGRITVDDVIDVVHEEADEDLAHMVGAPDIEEEEESLTRITRMRLPWLLITMCAGLVNSVIIKSMLEATGSLVAITIFVPAILAMGGNTGMQSSAICIRGIALGEKKYGKLFVIVSREIRVGVTLGFICGTATTLIVYVVLGLTHADTGTIPAFTLAFIVGAAMCNAMAFASAYGAIVPIVLHRFRVDPAVASGPFITTSNDLSATLIYFLTCLLMLGSR